MTKKEYQSLSPFLDTLTPEQLKVIWYIEARKHGNPCLSSEQKLRALELPLITPSKIRFRQPLKVGHKLYTDTGNTFLVF